MNEPRIVTRKTWGATPWRSQPYFVRAADRYFSLVHYHGNPPRYSRGVNVPREIEKIHLANGWSGVGYGWMVDLDGVAYEGRGFNLVGAHCPGRNRDGFSVYVAVGGNQEPTEKALLTVKWLISEGERLAKHKTTRSDHGAYYQTACAGPFLRPWARGLNGKALPSTDAPKPAPGRPTSFVEAYQYLLEVSVDGKWGAITDARASLMRDAARMYWGWPRNTRTTINVKEVQGIVDVTQDGIVGPNTKAALRRWIYGAQKVMGKIDTDGYWGESTEARYQELRKANLIE